MNGLDLFSGIGGIGIALEPWVRTVAYCERDRYAQGVLLSRMRSGDIDQAPIWDDVTTLRADLLPRIDIIFGGFPCQDLSVAGLGKGLAGERSGLFFEIVRLARECEPRFVFLENVPAIRTRGGETVVKELAKIGYDCRWTTLSAAAVGAPHKRERWFLLAHSNSVRKLSAQGEHDRIGNGCKNVAHANSLRSPSQSVGDVRELAEASGRKEETGDQSPVCFTSCGSDVAHANGTGFQEERAEQQESSGVREEFNHSCDNSWWAVEPSVGRVVNELPYRAHRIRCLGNSVVPLQVQTAFKKLAGIY